MKGLELSRAYYEAYGRKMLEENFRDIFPFIASGLIGSGSECFGYDDEVSKDHDFGPGFCVFIPGEDIVDRRSAFLLEKAYASLPDEYEGYSRPSIVPVGGARTGVIRLPDFLAAKTGHEDGKLSGSDWLWIPEQDLAELTNGEIFFDNYGELTRIREELSFYPEDIRRKKLAGQLLLMAQSGQYNYLRCLDHGEQAAAQLAVLEFVKAGMSAVFLLNRKYKPYYKWSFRAFRQLTELPFSAGCLERLMTTGNGPDEAGEKSELIEFVSAGIIKMLMAEELTKAAGGDLEKHAYSVNDGISDPELRNMHILAAV